MKDLTPDQRAEVDRLKRTDGESVEAKYLEALRGRNPHLTDDQLRLICLFTDDLVKVTDQQKDALAGRDVLLKKAYRLIENYQVWAWSASALTLVLMAMYVFDLRLP